MVIRRHHKFVTLLGLSAVCLSLLLLSSDRGISQSPNSTQNSVVPSEEVMTDLEDPDPQVRLLAAEELYRIGMQKETAIAVISAALKDPNPAVRLQAAGALYRMNVQKETAIAVISAALKDPNPEVRLQAARTLYRTGRQKEAATAVIVAALKDPNPEVRLQAAETLYRIGIQKEAATAAIVAALKDPNPEVRILAVQRLGRSRDTQIEGAIPALIVALKDSDLTVRLTATTTIAEFGSQAEAAIPALTQLLKDPYEGMRVAAAAALWDVGAKPDVVLPTLIAGVKAQYADSPTKLGDAETTRLSAVSTLGKMGVVAKAAIPALTVASKDKDKQMQLAAAQSLAKIKGAQDGDVSLLLINLKYSSANEAGSRERTISDLARLGEKAKPAVPMLLTILKQDPNYRVRQLVPIALIDISPNDKTVVAALIAALKDRDEEVRASSAYALGEIGPAAKAAVPDLVAALKVRPANRQPNLDYVPIATALVNIGAAQDVAVPILTAAFKDGTCHYYSLCTNAARALRKTGSDITLASSTLVEVLNKVEPSNQVGIVHIALTLLELSAEVEPATTALIAVANRTEKSLITSDDPKAEWNGSDRRYLAYRMAVMVERLQKNPNRLSTAEMAATVASLERVLQVLATPKEPKVSNATLERIRRSLSALKAPKGL